jgi:N-acetylglucosamine-6-phosphate deacetylase
MSTDVFQGTLILPDRLVPGGQIVIDEGVIQAVVDGDRGYRATGDFGEDYIAPGFIDLHVHGIAGADTMDGTSESLTLMAQRFAAHGVTGFLATTMTESRETISTAVQGARSYLAEQPGEWGPRACLLGVHLEGPWISPRFKGAQNEEFIRDPEEHEIHEVLEAAGDAIRKVTLAPERPGADRAIALLRERGIFVSIGHTGATYEQALRAIDLGASHFTHCFNATTALNHRRPGVVGASLLTRDTYAELIADALHVHPDVMRLLIQVKGRERVILITDAMSAAERPDGVYALGGQEVLVHKGEARLTDGTLAGSTLVFDQAIRNVITLSRVSLIDAVYMGSTTPAEAIGLGATKGKIRSGHDADLTVLDGALRPRAVVVGGRVKSLDPALTQS